MQGIDVVDINVTEQIVRTEAGGSHIPWAVAQHHAHAVTLDKSPIRRILPTDAEAQDVAELGGTLVEVLDREHECPRGDLWLHAPPARYWTVSLNCSTGEVSVKLGMSPMISGPWAAAAFWKSSAEVNSSVVTIW